MAARGDQIAKRAAAIAQQEQAKSTSGTEAPSNKVPFDFDKEWLHPDFKAVCQLPFDTQSSGVKFLRGIVFPKGSAIHYPDDDSRLLVAGEFRRQCALELVHFAPSTARDPELLLCFIDLGMANSAMTGVSVETLPLPLHVQKKTYNTESRMTPIKDVVAFEQINCGKAPWSVHLKPCLEKIVQFKRLEVFNHESLKKWICFNTEAKINKLEKWATEDIIDAVKGISRQDESQGSKQQSVFTARLESMVKEILKLPLAGYDRSLDTRITKLKLGSRGHPENAPVWLNTPQQKQLLRGDYDFSAVKLQPKCIEFPESLEAIDEEPPDHKELETQSERDLVESFQQDEQEIEEGIGSPRLEAERRKVIPTKRFDPPLGGGGTKPKKPKQTETKAKTEQKVKTEAGDGPLINPRSGLPYKRGPYDRTGTAGKVKSPTKRNVTTGDKEKSLIIDLTKDHKAELGALQAKVDELQKEIVQLNKNLSTQMSKMKQFKKNRKDQVAYAHTRGRLEQTNEATKMFQMGLQAGMQMSKGECPNFPTMDAPPPAAAASTSAPGYIPFTKSQCAYAPAFSKSEEDSSSD